MITVRRFIRAASICLALGATAPIAHAQDPAPAAPPAAAAPQQAAPSTAAPATPADPDYQLGSGDKVRVTVFGEPTLSGEFYVTGSGLVSLPLLGEVKAAGLSVRQFQETVETALRNGYLKQPRVSAEVLNFRPFYILGEVSKPGTYPYTSGLTVQNAVATAGGYTYRADKNKVYIKRLGEEKETKMSLTPSTQVAPGDTVRIGERFF
ncbi:polysaccharide biosynthesis protein [Caulobacter flavus]|uniref:Polysaccharide biosynthesis protein n=1 Tax=Caulobacter flavus TaxID=1679497 RepID=A0A2N5CR38_9CAUL|nr:polysaccharide biosynthesis/export family protein [Caulobacter flavus]AYV45597.1 polysaccharide biosynthesis protein [Caulobacter flavus]PLR10637.1 polysaccharide biosynthesis protein [Caulobacter flavus]